MKKTTLVCVIALAGGSGGATAGSEVLDIHDVEAGYLVEVQATEQQDSSTPWHVPNEDDEEQLAKSEFAAAESAVASGFSGIANSSEE